MSSPKGIFWLTSYPKSGNTWFRIVLSRLLNKSDSLSYINDINTILDSPMVANRGWMNKILGFDSRVLDENELYKLRPAAYTWYAQQLKQTTYIKIHDAYTLVEKNTPLIPAEGCLGAVYFIRNPLDVAVSLAHHAQCPIDWSIHMMGNKDFAVPLKENQDKQIRQQLLSWSMHVQSWVSDLPIKVLVLRYEDMFFKPLETFSKAMAFLNLDRSEIELQKAIDDASFGTLQAYEQRFGFKEKPAIKGQFFRKGIVGDWQNTLNESQIHRITHDHADMMRTYGYLDNADCPIVFHRKE